MNLDKGQTATLNKKHLPKFVPYNAKIADITHADTNKHTLALDTALSETRTIIAIIVSCERIGGAGSLQYYSNEGTTAVKGADLWSQATICMAAGTNRLQYALDTANDDFDLYCFGYVVED